MYIKKFLLIILCYFLLTSSRIFAKDIIPITHNDLGQTEIALDLDSIKKIHSDDVYSVEILNLNDNIWSQKNQVPIFKYEIRMTDKQYRIIEVYSRYKNNWKVAELGFNQAKLVENGQAKWLNIEKETLAEIIYMTVFLVSQYGKKSFLENLYSK